MNTARTDLDHSLSSADPPSVTLDVSLSETPAAGGGVARSAGILAIGNILSRTLGLLRETIISYLFGASGELSAFILAARVPTMIYDFLVGGLLSAALVPVFSDYARPERRTELWRVVSAVLSVVGLGMAVLMLLLEVFAWPVARLIGGGFDEDLLNVVATSLRIMGPAVFCFGLAGILTGLLYALKSFAFPAMAAAVFNLGIVVCAPLLSPWVGIYSLPIGVTVGSLSQLLLLLPALWRTRVKLRLVWSHPALRHILLLYIPVSVSLLVGQFQVLVDANLVSHTGPESASWMRYATTLIQFPLGLVPVAVSLAALPTLSQHAAAGRWPDYRTTFARGLRLVLVLLVPSIMGLYILAEPIVRLLFQHGNFVARDTVWTARALHLYLLGLGFAGVDFLLNYAFYARQDTRTPAIVGIMAVGVYLVVALALIQPFGFLGLVLADSAKHIGHACVMWVLMIRRVGSLRGQGIRGTLWKSVVASGLMAIVLWLSTQWLVLSLPESFVGHVLVVVAAVAIGGTVYATGLWVLRVEEVTIIASMVRRRVQRS